VGVLVRKRPCPCGSGRLARDCCGRFRRLSEMEMSVAFLGRQSRQARDLIGPFSPVALEALRAEAATLPAQCTAFTAALLAAPDPVPADVRKLARAVELAARGAPDADPRLRAALHRADSPVARVAVARALIALREGGLVDEHLAAAALVALPGGRSTLAEAALLQAGTSVAGVAGPTSEVQSELAGVPWTPSRTATA